MAKIKEIESDYNSSGGKWFKIHVDYLSDPKGKVYDRMMKKKYPNGVIAVHSMGKYNITVSKDMVDMADEICQYAKQLLESD